MKTLFEDLLQLLPWRRPLQKMKQADQHVLPIVVVGILGIPVILAVAVYAASRWGSNAGIIAMFGLGFPLVFIVRHHIVSKGR